MQRWCLLSLPWRQFRSTYENALALAIGANVGTTVTAILGAMSANVEGRRLAVAHLVFNLVTAAIAISLIYQLTNIVDVISQNIGIAEQNYMLKLAVFHRPSLIRLGSS